MEQSPVVIRVDPDPLEAYAISPGWCVGGLVFLSGQAAINAQGALVGEGDFEAQGITLAQALARVGGLQDYRADPKGVFVFRVENGLPTVYQMDLRNPAAFFSAREFPMRTKDVLYIANAPATELQKFLGILGAVVAPASTLRQL
jgi:polysaccharide export outer membrane protein